MSKSERLVNIETLQNQEPALLPRSETWTNKNAEKRQTQQCMADSNKTHLETPLLGLAQLNHETVSEQEVKIRAGPMSNRGLLNVATSLVPSTF